MSIERKERARGANVERPSSPGRDAAQEDSRAQQKIYEDALLDALALPRGGTRKEGKAMDPTVPPGTAGRKPERQRP